MLFLNLEFIGIRSNIKHSQIIESLLKNACERNSQRDKKICLGNFSRKSSLDVYNQKNFFTETFRELQVSGSKFWRKIFRNQATKTFDTMKSWKVVVFIRKKINVKRSAICFHNKQFRCVSFSFPFCHHNSSW